MGATCPAPPRAALPYRDELIRTARAVWGLAAPVPVFAAQIHTESGWRADAVSPVGALGLAQFMPATARWIAQTDPLLAQGQPYNPAWAMRALVTYDQRLYGQSPARYSPHDRMWVALRGYNGGLGHWNNEARVAAAHLNTTAPPPGRVGDDGNRPASGAHAGGLPSAPTRPAASLSPTLSHKWERGHCCPLPLAGEGWERARAPRAAGERGGTPSREQVDAACGQASRSRVHCPENLAYPRRVLIDAQPRYASWGPML